MINSLRQAARPLRRKPGFCAVVVLTIGLGVGSTSAIYSLLYQVMWRDLPAARPDQLVVLHMDGSVPGNTRRTNFESVFSYPMYQTLRRASAQGVQGLLARAGTRVGLARGEQGDQAWAEAVSGNYFALLGLRPAAGRLLAEGDDTDRGGNDVVVLGYDFWQSRYGGAAGVVGEKLLLNGHPMEVVGIAPSGFRGLDSGRRADVYVPLSMYAVASPGFNGFDDVGSQWLNIVGRLGPGASREAAEAAINAAWLPAITDDIGRMGQKPGPGPLPPLRLQPARAGINELELTWKQSLLILISVAGGLLLIACTNLVSLFMVRGAGRQREIAIRLSLGATPWRVASQLLAEAMLLAVIGGVCAELLSVWITGAILQLVPASVTNGWVRPEFNWNVFAFGLALSVAAGFCVAIWPALQLSVEEPVSALREQGPSLQTSTRQRRGRKKLLGLQIAFSIMLLACAGLFAKSLGKLLHHDVGFDEKNLVSFTLDPRLQGQTNERSLNSYGRVVELVSALPDVAAVSYCRFGPYVNANSSTNVTVEGYQPAEHENMNSNVNIVAPGYFNTLGIALVAGREFTDADGPNGQKVAVVNEAFAKRFLPGRDPVGARMAAGNAQPDTTIVGVARDAQLLNLRDPQKPFFFLPFAQGVRPKEPSALAVFVVRAKAGDERLPATLRDIVGSVDKTLPITSMDRVEFLMRESAYVERSLAVLTSAAALLALFLSALGIYGVVSYTVESRTPEIGIRMALGANRRAIFFMVLRDILWVTVLGIAGGILGGVALSRLAASQLYRVEPTDPAVFSAAAGVLLFIALVAAVLPAKRAVKIDPARAIRYE